MAILLRTAYKQAELAGLTENKQLKVLLADLCERKILLAG
jgi:hypothetical protein